MPGLKVTVDPGLRRDDGLEGTERWAGYAGHDQEIASSLRSSQ
jgi:hypothetical protein